MPDNPARLPFSQAIEFFKNKIKLPSASWTDIWEQQHSHAFVVAGAAQDALVADFYNAIFDAKQNGGGYEDFRQRFDEIVAKHGWSYNGSAGWRSKIIYDTNINQSYNAGRYQQIKAHVPLAEFLTYAPDLRSMTGGRGIYSMRFSHYDEVPAQIAEKVIEEVKKGEE